MRYAILILCASSLLACTNDGDPVETGTEGDTEAATSAASASTMTGSSMSASSTSAGSASSSSAGSDTNATDSDPSDSGSGTDPTTGGHSVTETGSGSDTDPNSESGSGSTGPTACIPEQGACGNGEGECCEATQCVAGQLASTCQRCGVEGDPCTMPGGQAPCCEPLECVNNGAGMAPACADNG